MSASIYQNIGTGTGGVGAATIRMLAQTNLAGDTGTLLDYTLANNYSPCCVQILTLSSGANTIDATSSPMIAQAGGVWIIPPSTNTQTLTLKGVTGDTGIAISKVAPTFIAFYTTPPTSFVLTAGAQITGVKLAWV